MEKLVNLLYGKKWIYKLYSFLFCKNLLFSRFAGYLAGLKFSKMFIASFINRYKIRVEDFEKKVEDFSSFQDFFIRCLKKEARPIAPDFIVSPADGSITVYPDIKESFLIKEKKFSFEKFLQDKSLAEEFKQGSITVIRLDVFDYHRFHFPFDAIPSSPQLINGFLYSVRPEAIARNANCFAENKRILTILKNPRLGRVLFIAIGATSVGTINMNFSAGQSYKKGDEMGYFALGGSSIVLVFREKIAFRDPLLPGEETRVVCNSSINMGLF